MARATFINAILSGKLDGSVYARNKGGAYVRSWVKPTNPKTVKQSQVRSGFSDASKSFAGLSSMIKKQWNYFATSYFKPKKIKSGVIYSGFNAFQSLTNTLNQAIRNQRDGSITSPIGVTATFTPFDQSIVIPGNVFSGMPLNVEGASVPVTIIDATIKTDGEITATFAQGTTNGGAPLEFSGVDGDRSIGFLLYGNVPNSSSPTENICLGGTGYITITDGWDSDTTDFKIKFNANADFIANRKMWYTIGQKAIVTAYIVSNKGELSYCGNTEIIINA